MSTQSLPDFRAPPTRKGQTWSGEHPVVACFQDRCVSGRLRSVIWGLNTEPVFTLALSPTDLAERLPDLGSVMRIYKGAAPLDQDLIFTGYVEELAYMGEEAVLRASSMVGAKSTRLGGLAVVGVAPGELFWSLASFGGFPAHISTRDGWPPPQEDFFVVVPVDGVDLEIPEQVGDVLFTADEGLRRQWSAGDGPPPKESNDFIAAFRDTKVAALTTVRSSFVLEAERTGFARIEAATARIGLVSRQALPIGLDGRPRPFTHARLREHVRVRRVVGVLSKSSQRQWIRGVDMTAEAAVITADALAGMRRALAAPLASRDAEAIKAWRRAVASNDPASMTVALVEALEFYAAGAEVVGLFKGDELAAATKGATQAAPWTREQRDRLERVIGEVNNAPFFTRLRARVAGDGLALTEGEMKLLTRVRKYRNDLVHGRGGTNPDPDDLSAAVGVVGRLLTYRIGRSGEPSRDQTSD